MKQIASLITIPNIKVDERLSGQFYIPIEKNDFISGYFRSLDKYFTDEKYTFTRTDENQVARNAYNPFGAETTACADVV